MTFPLILNFMDWPRQDQSAWKALFADGSLFDGGTYEHWVEGGRKKRLQGYGRWLSFILSAEPELSSATPQSRITRGRVESYVAHELSRCKPITVICRIEDLLAVARGFDPDDDWPWLEKTRKRLYARYGPSGLKPRLPVSSADVFKWAMGAMGVIDQKEDLTPLQRASQYRDALMIGLLIARPVRARAFIAIKVGINLVETSAGFRLEFAATDMKDKRPHAWDVPDRLVLPLRRYLEHHRTILLRGSDSDALWITRYGKPMTREGWTRSLGLRTEAAFGIALRPHAFRHIAATSIAIQDPGHHGIIRDVLGHATMTMAERHYNRATSLESCNKLQSFIEDTARDMSIIGNRKRMRSSRGRSGR
ncbi:MAG: tyrosine-type recombinase/integrase [Rhizobiaceae bacterium]|nr:tyrosine-type recombinase/integrase [Rhizobiaceae bacterium]